ncbi:MAG: hypothetical protein QG662_171 [Pseudomonadota bacterium]|nr:hypothetical protein [Pseudomonadota bacterium]
MTVIASEARQSSVLIEAAFLDCRVATLLAMTHYKVRAAQMTHYKMRAAHPATAPEPH